MPHWNAKHPIHKTHGSEIFKGIVLALPRTLILTLTLKNLFWLHFASRKSYLETRFWGARPSAQHPPGVEQVFTMSVCKFYPIL